MNIRLQPRQTIALLGISVALLATACGTGKGASAEVASLGSTSGTTPVTTSPVNTQDALLKYAACMRQNGVNMADPTFDADGNPTGGGFGPNSGVDRSSAEFQTAQKACGNLLQGVQLGGRGRNGVDRATIQNSLNDFTACLRDAGLQVDDITFGPPAGGAANGAAPDGSIPAGAAGQSGGGFGGPPGGGSAPAGANGGPGPGGAGFDPTARTIQRLGLDSTDPAVIAALAKCQPILTAAFQPATSTTTATTP